MIVRGLLLPDFEHPPDADKLLASYLASTKDSLSDLLHSGARWPEKLGGNVRSMAVYAGVRALEDPETSPAIDLSAISFAYLLYHWNLISEAFQTLQSIDAYLSQEGVGANDLHPSEDPFYVAGLMCSHGRWHGERDLDDAIAWFRRSLDRPGGLQYQGAIQGAIPLCLHRQRKISAALQGYKTSVERLRFELDRELADDEPIFDDDLQAQIGIFESQQRRLTEGKEPNAVMTRYGWAMYSTGKFEHWVPVG